MSPKKKRYAPGETVTIECKDGYEADGAAETVCENGKFTNPKLKCKKAEKKEEKEEEKEPEKDESGEADEADDDDCDEE